MAKLNLSFSELRNWRDWATAGTRHILGLALDDTGVVVTELSIHAGRPQVRRTGEFPWPQELTAENAEALGQGLRHFLREQGFTARRAVVGLAAKWVLTKEIDTPAVNPEVLAGMLSIQAERAFSLNADELVFDYCGGTPVAVDRNRDGGRSGMVEKNPILLLAARRQIVEQIKTLLEAAGLHVQAITLSALACSKTLSEGGLASRYGLYTRPGYCEFWAQLEGTPRFIKHVALGKNGAPAAYADQLAAAIERLVLLSPVPGQAPPHRITAYDACGLPDELIEELSQRLGPQITVANGRAGLSSQGLGLQDHPDEARAIAAAAVALTGIEPQKPPVDFLNPRIGAKKAVSHRRALVWGAGAAAACFLGLLVLLAVWHGRSKTLATAQQWLKENDKAITAARANVDLYRYASSWYSQQPRFLECLKELTTAFPDEPTIWARSLALNENGTGSLVGKTVSEASFYDVLGKMTRNAAVFSDARMIYLRDAGRDSREKEYAINFKLQGAK
jgi:hypothetical protein